MPRPRGIGAVVDDVDALRGLFGLGRVFGVGVVVVEGVGVDFLWNDHYYFSL